MGPMRGDSLAEAMEGFGRRLHGSDDAIKTWHADPPSPHDLRGRWRLAQSLAIRRARRWCQSRRLARGCGDEQAELNMPAPPKSDDPLPRNTIRLSDAFERYYRATAPDVSAVEAELNAALPGPESLG